MSRATSKDWIIEALAEVGGRIDNDRRSKLRKLTEDDLIWLRDYVESAVEKAKER